MLCITLHQTVEDFVAVQSITTITGAFLPNSFLIICLICAFRAKQPKNIKLIERELENKQMAHITHFLKAFLSFIVAEHRERDPRDEEIRQGRVTLFDSMLVDALSFSNIVNADSGSEFIVSLEA